MVVGLNLVSSKMYVCFTLVFASMCPFFKLIFLDRSVQCLSRNGDLLFSYLLSFSLNFFLPCLCFFFLSFCPSFFVFFSFDIFIILSFSKSLLISSMSEVLYQTPSLKVQSLLEARFLCCSYPQLNNMNKHSLILNNNSI